MNLQYVNQPVKPISQWANRSNNQSVTVSHSVYKSYSQPVIKQVSRSAGHWVGKQLSL